MNERAKIPLPGAGEAVLGAAPSPTQDRAPGEAVDLLAEHAATAITLP